SGTLYALAEDIAAIPANVDSLVTVDKANGCALAAKSIVNGADGAPLTDLDGLAWYCGKLFATRRTDGNLYRIDPATGAAAVVPSTGGGPGYAGSPYPPANPQGGCPP